MGVFNLNILEVRQFFHLGNYKECVKIVNDKIDSARRLEGELKNVLSATNHFIGQMKALEGYIIKVSKNPRGGSESNVDTFLRTSEKAAFAIEQHLQAMAKEGKRIE